MKAAAEARLRALEGRDDEVAARPARVCTSFEMKNFRKSTASFGAPLVTSQPLMPPSVSVGSPLPPGTASGNRTSRACRRRGPSCRPRAPLRAVDGARSPRIIAALPSPKKPSACGFLKPRKPFWNGWRSTSCLIQLAGLLEGLALEAAVLALQRRLEGRLAAERARRDASSRSAAATCPRRRPRSA